MAIMHGMSKTRIYKIWCHMRSRCYCSTDPKFSRYGMRGIIVCDDWKNNFLSFHEWAISSGYTDALTIDRIDNNGNYEPKNCKWSDLVQQNRNRSSTKLTKTDAQNIKILCSSGLKLHEVAKKYGISVSHAGAIKTERKWK